ncbi:MAG: hypothetical protein ACJAR1_002425 [Rubritalea sp.]|jgi:hypothetical protein
MNSINSWINEDEVRKLAEDLTASPEEMKGWPSDDFDGCDGFAIPEKQGEGSSNTVSKELEIFSENDSKTEIDIGQEVKESKSSSLAIASAMAASVGLIGKRQSEPVKESIADTRPAEPDAGTFPPICDHCLNEVPVNIDENARVPLPSVHPDKGIGTFEQIDKQLAKTVKANGICVIDRDGDVLYSSMKNQSLVAFTINATVGTKLMRTQDGEFANIRVKIAAGEYLEFVSVKSTRGVLILAASMDHVLGNTNAQYVASDVLKIANLV